MGQGRVVVITGASSGIGRLAARRFAGQGASVVLAARGIRGLEDAAQECRDVGGRVLVVPTDVADVHAVRRLADAAVEEFGRIDVWVNNAAVMAYGHAVDIPFDVHRRVVEVNLLGAMYGSVAAIEQFQRQGGGVVINVASLYAKMTSPFVSPYVTSKFGLLGFSEVLRQELSHKEHIKVCTILPGSIDTPIFRHTANFSGRVPRPVPPVSNPERVARAIVRAADRPRREVSVGFSQKVASWGHAALPRTYDLLVPHVMRRIGFTGSETKDSPGNVFFPLEDEAAPGGDWRAPRSRVAATAAAALLSAAGGVGLGWWQRRR